MSLPAGAENSVAAVRRRSHTASSYWVGQGPVRDAGAMCLQVDALAGRVCREKDTDGVPVRARLKGGFQVLPRLR
jgi:hypothetical protein